MWLTIVRCLAEDIRYVLIPMMIRMTDALSLPG
jgi:hypothetical protein